MRLTAHTSATPLLQGSIDVIHGDILHGWLIGSTPDVRPLVFVDDEPAVLLDMTIPRPDVCKRFGLAEESVGFACRLPAARQGSMLSLYGATPDGVFLVTRRALAHPVCEQWLEAQLRRAAATAQHKDAVGIVCWDGAHNPIGRAKVLYDIASTRRPAVLLCYLHEEFGGKLWSPLLHCDIPLVTIPWEQRHQGHLLLHRYGIVFDTVWICKPRLPSFQLAAAVSHAKTHFLLDMDDDEDAFSAHQTDSRACHDAPGTGLAHFLRDQIAARTVVSPPLQQRFGGHIVRHTRCRAPRPAPDGKGFYNIGFIGTVRPHKNILTIARAVRLLSVTTGLPFRFHTYGDIRPPEYREALEHAGAVLHGVLPFEELPDATAQMHVLISGFPASVPDAPTRAIVEHQVPAKISDALAAGRPILVPDVPAVADLHNVPGIYLFTEDNFTDQLVAALSHKQPITLPEEFTPEGGYASFADAAQEASPVPALHALNVTPPDAEAEPQPALVLLWKQHDAGLYGRRVEQIARSYARAFSHHRVIILEFFKEPPSEQKPEEDLTSPVEDFTEETFAKEQLLFLKSSGLRRDGILFQTLRYRTLRDLRNALSSFLVRENLSPENTLLVLFPIIDALEDVEDILRPYIRLIDVVDNQLGWASDTRRRCRLLDQYFRLLAPAAQVIFNTEQTRDFFAARHFLDAAEAVVIPNWYTLPDGSIPVARPLPGSVRHLFYSGNMNDRLDWALLQAITALPDIQLHLAGTAQRARTELHDLIAHGAIYHGVTQERETLALLSLMDAAIVPHVLDEISMFMNPIKVSMYRAAGLPILCPSCLHLAGENLLLYDDVPHCLNLLSTLPKRQADNTISYCPDPASRAAEDAYMQLLDRWHPQACRVREKRI